jgi:hypothetical protein
MHNCKVIQVIETEERIGSGETERDPIRLLKQYYSLEGELIWQEEDKYGWDREEAVEEVKSK